MKKLGSFTECGALLFLALLACSVVVTSGCSKRETVLATVSGLSAAGAGASFLKNHETRNAARKKEITCLKYHNHGK